jgi:peptidoglycan/xylan/chitin deacetylase (PgdA/CDA1 family)
VDHNKWDRRGRGLGRGAARDEDLERTVALEGGAPEQAGAFDETLPLQDAGQRAERERQGPLDASFDGANYGRYRVGEAGAPAALPGGQAQGAGAMVPMVPAQFAGPNGEPGVPAQRGPRVSRRVLFAAGGLTLIGGCGVAAAANLAGSHSSKAASASPFGPGSATGPATHSASPSAAHSSAPASASPSNVSSSSARASAPADVSNPGSGINPGKVQSAPEYYVHAGPKVIALTLDDGPHPVYTPQVLALLQHLGIQATFCMIGRQVGENKSLVGEVVAAGHTIVNHTWDHADQSKLTLAKIRSEINRTNDALANVGVHPAIFRAPYGAWSPTVFQACAAADLRPLDWSVDPQDWARPGTGTIVSRILHQTRTGSIILEHDGGGDRSQTVAALKIVLPELLSQGYRFTMV